ncbi:shikimate kinase [Alphaproteobacteria bacterium]|nr:shikimate kinase [Alphaproteobacteria bacterium]
MLKKKKTNLTNIYDVKIITFIGMMGTGKSKFGRIISKNLNFNFYDIDLLIEQKFNNTIQTIFEEKGEKFFRQAEESIIEKLIFTISHSNQSAVISLGGGAFDNINTRTLLLKKSHVIWLNTPIDKLVNRVGDGSKRPMIRGNVNKSISELLKKRIKYYSLCHDQLNTNKLNQNQIIEQIINIISNYN